MLCRAAWCAILLLAINLVAAFAQSPSPTVFRSMPEHPIIEVRGGIQSLNFDLEVRNTSATTLRISQIELSVYDASRRLALRKSINTDAFAPSIAVIGKQVMAPGETLDVFNPFPQFEDTVQLAELQYSFCLLRESTEQDQEKNRHRLTDNCDFRERFVLVPRTYKGKTPLILPLRGEIFIWEGHDFYAHHQRVPLGSPRVQSMGITANSNSFADDFIYVDEQGQKYHQDPRRLENWYSYGKAIYAPGTGVVLAAVNDIPENWFEDAGASKIGYPKLAPEKDPKDIGNFVMLDHQNGEYSLLLHMKPGSVAVKPGDRVEQGQFLGRIGFSGDSIFPHLHYALMDGPQVFQAWGLPAYFSNFQRILGTKSVRVERGSVDSGDFLESNAHYPGEK